MSEETKVHPPERQGGQKDTNDLADIKDVQKTGMQEKGQQVDNLPEAVKGTDKPIQPQKR